MPSGAQLFAGTLADLDIRRVFTLVGDHLNDVLSALAHAGIEIVGMRHEAAVVHAADVHARITRKPALALVTGGPGHTNSLTGIATAHLACSPVIAVSGSRARSLADRQSFQDIDQVSMAKPVSKWAAEVSTANQITYYLTRAWKEASAGRQGAVHLTIPLDLFQSECPSPNTVVLRRVEAPPPSDVDVMAALKLIRAAHRPVVIAGSGVWWAGAGNDLQRFIELTNLPLYTITMARGVVSDYHPLCFGYADPALNRAARAAFQEADLFLVLGKRIDYRLALGGPRVLSPNARLIHVDIHPQEIGLNRQVDVGIQADVKKTLAALFSAATDMRWPRLVWIDRLAQLKTDWEQQLQEAMSDRDLPLHPAAVYREIVRVLPPETLLSWDGGDFTHWGRAIVPARVPGGWLRLGPLGTIGAALPNAIAMKLEKPDDPVVLITGDGALGFYIAEMDTAVRCKLPLVIITGNDSGWGLERELQLAQGTLSPQGETVACELRQTRYDLVMQGFGGGGENVSSLDQVAPAVRRALASTGPYCININLRGVRSPFTDWQIEGKTPVPR